MHPTTYSWVPYPKEMTNEKNYRYYRHRAHLSDLLLILYEQTYLTDVRVFTS